MFLCAFLPLFLCVCSASFKNTVGKGEIARTSNISFFHSVFNRFVNFLQFSSNLDLSSANSFSLEESKNRLWELDKTRHCVLLGYQSSRSRKIVRESRINEIKHVQNEKPLREFTHKYHQKKKRLQAR